MDCAAPSWCDTSVKNLACMAPLAGSPQARPPPLSPSTPAYSVPPSTTGRVRKAVANPRWAGCCHTGSPVATFTAWSSTKFTPVSWYGDWTPM